ncbi:MAG: invasion associated locus B family protein [Gammaproteobacteria bacterium]|nr:invasion associated locus B family protein [Gammaproteobacteria bacterium]
MSQVVKLILSLTIISLFGDVSQAKDGEYGDWVLHCKLSDELCILSQLAVVETDGERLMELNIPLSKNGQFGSNKVEFVLPLGLSLQKPPKLYIANQFMSELSVNVCLADGCYYSMPLSQVLLERFLGMFSGYVKIWTHRGEEIDIPISGIGTRAAHNAFKAEYLNNTN